VAIIGILAAVGVVAYQGYTASAKVNAVKSNHVESAKGLLDRSRAFSWCRSDYWGKTKIP